MKNGYTTGTCAAAAVQAAARLLAGEAAPLEVLVQLPEAGTAPLRIPVAAARLVTTFPRAAEATVQKDAGDDPDVTHGATVTVRLEEMPAPTGQAPTAAQLLFAAGDGVGTVTKAGLQIPPGEPAINPVPRQMMAQALRTVFPEGSWRMTVSVPGGRELAAKTFNPRLGIVDGISILGTTGIVRPFSRKALQDALLCSLDVATAAGISAPVLVPGNIGRRAVCGHFPDVLPDQVIEVSNEWGFMLTACAQRPQFTHWRLAGHPGKLAKFITQEWDTHSSRSGSALDPVLTVARELGLAPDAAAVADITTVDGFFAALPEPARHRLGSALAERILTAVQIAYHPVARLSVWLCDMQGHELGAAGPKGGL